MYWYVEYDGEFYRDERPQHRPSTELVLSNCFHKSNIHPILKCSFDIILLLSKTISKFLILYLLLEVNTCENKKNGTNQCRNSLLSNWMHLGVSDY